MRIIVRTRTEGAETAVAAGRRGAERSQRVMTLTNDPE